MKSTLRDCPGRLGALRDLSGRLAFSTGRHLTAPVVLLLMVAALIAPLASPSPAEASLCPPGMVQGPDIDVVNADGSVTRTPGPCVPAPRIDFPGGPIIDINQSDDQSDDVPPIRLDTGDEADAQPTPFIPVEAPRGEGAPNADVDIDSPVIDIVPAEGEETSIVEVHKHVCPDGYDATGKAFVVIYVDCTGSGDGISFSLTASGVDLGTQTVGSILSNTAQWADVPSGSIAINEFVPDEYGQPLVNCYLINPDGSTIGAEVQQVGPAVTYNLGAAEYFVCDWFNVPLPAEGDDPADEPGDILISKYECPEGYDAESAGIYDLAYECNTPLGGIDFGISDGSAYVEQGTTDSNGLLEFDQAPFGPLSIVETVPDGYGVPVVYCTTYELSEGGPIVDGPFKVTVDDGNQIFQILDEGQTLECSWYNVPTDSPADEPGDITITKSVCPDGYDAESADIYELTYDCNEPLEGVEFGVSDGAGYLDQQTTGAQGIVEFDQIPYGPISIVEQVPDGYGVPVVYCTSYLLTDSGPVVEGPFKVTVDDGNQIFHIFEEGQTLNCSWYNIPYEDDGSITIIKYTCPPGYDYTAYGADPAAECWDLTDGVTFGAQGQSGPLAPVVTGEAGAGTAVFADLEPGSYSVSEQVPAGTKFVFVLDCTGSSVPLIQSLPLSVGSNLDIIVGPGDEIICRWYNVPEHHERGDIEVIKYACTTVTFVSVDHCQRYEGGQSFRLTGVTGQGAGSSADGTTDATGRYVWAGLLPGAYEIDELGAKWCHASADYTDADGYLIVEAGVTTHVAVYNCGFTPPTKTPVKYPNTGVGPAAADLSGGSAAPVAPAGAPLATEETGSEIDLRLPAVRRGERPVEIVIEAADVDAPIEVLEVIDGAMQDPTGATHVAWYKDTAALGVSGHIVMAGHLNYWGVPEGVFFAIDQLEEGDEIVVTGESGVEYRYEVISVGQEDALAAPADDVLSPDGDTTLTLITCGGEWDAARGEYLSRTVVQAELIAS